MPLLSFSNKISKALDTSIYSLFDLDESGEYKCSCYKNTSKIYMEGGVKMRNINSQRYKNGD